MGNVDAWENFESGERVLTEQIVTNNEYKQK